jgi:two-component system, OmpR family, sensor histidine kinase KdpD
MYEMSKSPEDWLEQTAPDKRAGTFKLILGYAPGVGKTYNMLSEAIRRHRRGEDVVVGVIETHGRKVVAELAGQLETVPRKKLEYKGTIFEEMDVDAILARKPQVALIDEFAHTNVDGSKHRKRFEDVLELVDAKIDVLSTMNIQHLESVNPTVQSITGVQVRETVPDWVLQRADEIVMADLTPEALQTRMLRGDIYPLDRAEKALKNFFRRGNLMALRELALRQVTHAVDRSLETYLKKKNIDQNWGIQERIAVCISSHPESQQLIARGARIADRIGADFFAVYVEQEKDREPERARSLNSNFQFAENLSAKIVRLKGKDVASSVAQFVGKENITQVVFGRSAVSGWREYLYLGAIQRFLRNAPPVDVHIVTQRPD